uniref:DNA replication complex GINS protein PSF1 n=1 Tax=Parascaris univalens TaxID=6257 RepID=A0A914ZK23_PARUN
MFFPLTTYVHMFRCLISGCFVKFNQLNLFSTAVHYCQSSTIEKCGEGWARMVEHSRLISFYKYSHCCSEIPSELILFHSLRQYYSGIV